MSDSLNPTDCSLLASSVHGISQARVLEWVAIAFCLGEGNRHLDPGSIRSTKYSESKEIIAKFRLKLNKVGKTTRPFRYDINQIPYDYTVEVRNRFKGLELIDRVPEELWMEVCDIVQEAGIKTILKKKKYKKAKWLSERAL